MTNATLEEGLVGSALGQFDPPVKSFGVPSPLFGLICEHHSNSQLCKVVARYSGHRLAVLCAPLTDVSGIPAEIRGLRDWIHRRDYHMPPSGRLDAETLIDGCRDEPQDGVTFDWNKRHVTKMIPLNPPMPNRHLSNQFHPFQPCLDGTPLTLLVRQVQADQIGRRTPEVTCVQLCFDAPPVPAVFRLRPKLRRRPGGG